MYGLFDDPKITDELDGRREEIARRIAATVEVVDTGYITPCWLWTLADSGNGRGGGYPRMKLNNRTCAVHIVSYTNSHGYVPGNKQIDHLCRSRLCVRPTHLEMVSHVENQKRRDISRGLAPKRKKRTRSNKRRSVGARPCGRSVLDVIEDRPS